MRRILVAIAVLFVPVLNAGAQWTPPTTPGSVTGPIYYNGGNVGIGVGGNAPGALLDVGAGAPARGGYTQALIGGAVPQVEFRASGASAALSYDGTIFRLWQNGGIAWRNTLLVDSDGKLGVGIAPSATLHVAGDVRLGSSSPNGYTDLRIFTDTSLVYGGVTYQQVNTITPVSAPATGTVYSALHIKNATAGGTNQVDLIVDGTINSRYQDVAEWVKSGAALDPATVVVLDPLHENQVVPSTTSYDTTVAGVVSSTPGLILGVGAAGKEKIATTGRVRVKVDATRGAIAIGDLLVTSDVLGMAMKSQPIEIKGRRFHQPGTVIGKALQPLSSGQGTILVLLSLQ